MRAYKLLKKSDIVLPVFTYSMRAYKLVEKSDIVLPVSGEEPGVGVSSITAYIL